MKKKTLVISFFMIFMLILLQSTTAFPIPAKEDSQPILGDATIEVRVQEKQIGNSTLTPLANVNVSVKFAYWPGPVLGRFPKWGDAFGDTGTTDSNGMCTLTVKTLTFAALNFFIQTSDDQARKNFGFANVRAGETEIVEITYYTA